MAVGQNPSITVGPAAPQPAPVPKYGDKFVLRTYQAFKTESTAGTGVNFLQSSFSAPGPYYVDKISIWKVGVNGTGIRATFSQGISTDLGTDDIEATDFGSADSLPGVTFKVPLGHAKQVANVGSNTLISAAPNVTDAALQTFVCNLSCWVQI